MMAEVPFITLRANLSDVVRQGVALHSSGMLEEAEKRYRAVLKAEANYFDALHMLGVVRMQQGRFFEAATFITAALKQNPRSAAAYVNLGNAQQAMGHIAEAIKSFRQAIRLQPDLADAHCNLGSALIASKHFESAVAALQKGLQVNPRHAQAHNNLGNALGKLQRYEEAAASYRRALEIAPNYPEARYNLGIALSALQRHEEAIASYKEALTARPDLAKAANNLATELMKLNRFEEALPAIRNAVALSPDYVDAHSNLGLALSRLWRNKEAAASYRKALSINPGFAPALKNLAVLLQKSGQLDEALLYARRAIDLDPDDGGAKSMYVGIKRRICDWRDLASEERSLVAMVGSASNPLPFTLMNLVDDPELHHRTALRHVEFSGFDRAEPLARRVRYAHDRIRVAYLSADFHEHATAYLMTEIFELHDRDRFQVSAFSWGPDDGSAVRQRLTGAFDQFHAVHDRSDLEVARQMRALEIDIAVDLKGYTDNCRSEIFAHRPAPIQINFLGYPGTMGGKFMDYALVDRIVVPPDQQPFFAEELLYLPGCYQPNDRKRVVAERTPSRAECGLPEHGFVFACFNNNHKITPACFDIFMRLLDAVPDSVLWLLEDNRWARDNLCREAAGRGVTRERLVFAPRRPLAEHLARQRLADLFLDTLPYNAHTTASDALWVGVPVLTCRGRSFPARVAASLLDAVGLPELVTRDLASFEATALELARSPAALRSIRQRLADGRDSAPLFDSRRFCRELEAVYDSVWRRLSTD